MAADYTGNPNGAAQVPAPQPGPGTLPHSSIPSGADTRSIESITQQMKAKDDFIAYLQSVAKYRPPRTPNGTTGFTTVAHTGAGTGTIVPTALSTTQAQSTSLGGNFVYKITVPGAVGTAKFQYSNDGGLTYNGSDIATAATDSSSGVTVTMTGTFTNLDLYAFSCTDVSLATFEDFNSNVRGLSIDRMGYPCGPHIAMREDWFYGSIGIGTSQTGTALLGNWGPWFCYTGASGAIDNNSGGPTAGYGGSFVHLDTGATNGSKAYMAAGQQANGVINADTTFLDAVMEFDFALSAYGANLMTAWMGWSSVVTPDSTNGNWLLLKWKSGGYGGTGSLGFSHNNNSLNVDDILPFVPTAGASSPNIRCRIEYHGSATALGHCARVFLAQGAGMPWQLVDVVTATLPSGPMFPFFGSIATSATPTATLRVGSIRMIWNRWAKTGGEL